MKRLGNSSGHLRIALDCSNDDSFKMFSPLNFTFRCLDFQLENPSDAIIQCNEALKIDENDVDALCDRAEAHMLNEMYDEGTKMPFFNLYFHVPFTIASLSFRFTVDIFDCDLR